MTTSDFPYAHGDDADDPDRPRDALDDDGYDRDEENPVAGPGSSDGPADPLGSTDGGEADEPEEPLESADVIRRLAGLLGGPSIGLGDVRVRGQNATGHGAVAIGTVNLTTAGADGAGRIWYESLSEHDVRELAEGYAPTPSDQQLDRHLKRRHLVCLSGPSSSGRFTSAVLAAARRHGHDGASVLGAEQPADLLGSSERLPGGRGYVLRLADTAAAAVDGFTLVALAARAETTGSTLVLVGDFSRRRQDLAGHVVEHRVAPAVEVFRTRLRQQLTGRCVGWCADGCDGACVDRYIDEGCVTHPLLSAYLAGEPRPSEVVPVVELIARTVPHGPALTERLEQLLPRQLRERATQILDVGRHDGIDGWAADQARAFRLACAVLAGQPVTEIRQAAQRMLGADLTGIAPTGPQLRGPDLDTLLGSALRQAVVVVSDTRSAGGQRIEFGTGSEQLRSTLLEVSWTDWWPPAQLLGWLAGLVRSDVPGVRQAAAGAIGWSAGQDVRAALQTVGDLARERRAGVRQAAAIVLVAMAMQPRLRQRVRTELDQWAAGPAAHLRDTVARAYGLGLARLWPDAALMQLRLVAQARMQRRNNSVVRGLVEVYRDGHAAALVPELVDWTASDDPEVRLHAARTIRVLADRWAEPPREHWPELLDLIRQRVIETGDVAALWSVALSMPQTAYRSWRTLGLWLNRADGDSEVTVHCLALLRRVIAGRPPLRHRLDHQIRHVWRPVMPHNNLLNAVHALIDKDLL
ncbi:hypothetical protein GA0070606_1033 [Micromonospora citrea]|uniref:HEAT repeat-containing protein n=1 Tax=Micromonospora citrea TaxID=47855 RepID=A0A1C6TY50_9ACTN|nr:hypothetical protein [Micromonospora citrea]SCL46687.1 hypothetical protein GA0070606_1033 [Micromonospora citrea]